MESANAFKAKLSGFMSNQVFKKKVHVEKICFCKLIHAFFKHVHTCFAIVTIIPLFLLRITLFLLLWRLETAQKFK